MNLEMAQKILSEQPFSVLIGVELRVFEPSQAELMIPLRPELLQQHGFVHGGVLSYAADNAITFAAGTVLGSALVTAEYKINYLRPAKGEALVVRADVVHAGKRQAVCRCDVFAVKDGKTALCAVAQGSVSKIELKES